MTLASLHPIDLWSNLDVSPLLFCFAAVAFALGLAALVPAIVWAVRSPVLSTGALVGRSLLAYVGSTLTGTGLFFGLLGLSELWDERGMDTPSAIAGFGALAMMSLGPCLVAASFGWDVVLGVRAHRARRAAGPLVVAVFAGAFALLHVGLGALMTWASISSR